MSNQINAVELSRSLIQCSSVTPEDGGTQETLGKVLTDLGFSCYSKTFTDKNTPDIKNLYARLGNSSPNFCFAGHTDVVPVGDANSWTQDPFGGDVINGNIYGRGASDMKTAIACFVEAISRFLKNHSSDFGGSVSLLITGAEEGPALSEAGAHRWRFARCIRATRSRAVRSRT